MSLAGLVLLSSCAPRGETYSLEEVLNMQEQGFRSSLQSAALAGAISETVNGLQTKLQNITKAAGPEVANQSQQISEDLVSLLPHSGFTSRPAMTELANQFRMLGQDSGAATDRGATVKLLVARTYSILNAELSGVKFAIS